MLNRLQSQPEHPAIREVVLFVDPVWIATRCALLGTSRPGTEKVSVAPPGTAAAVGRCRRALRLVLVSRRPAFEEAAITVLPLVRVARVSPRLLGNRLYFAATQREK